MNPLPAFTAQCLQNNETAKRVTRGKGNFSEVIHNPKSPPCDFKTYHVSGKGNEVKSSAISLQSPQKAH